MIIPGPSESDCLVEKEASGRGSGTSSQEKKIKKNARRLYVKIDLPVMKGCLSPVSFGRTNGLRAKKPAVSIVMASRSRCFALEGILIGNSPRKKARDIL